MATPIDHKINPACTYDPDDLAAGHVQTLLDAGWQRYGNTLYDPAHWRQCGPEEEPDWSSYEDMLVALTDEARAWADGECESDPYQR